MGGFLGNIVPCQAVRNQGAVSGRQQMPGLTPRPAVPRPKHQARGAATVIHRAPCADEIN